MSRTSALWWIGNRSEPAATWLCTTLAADRGWKTYGWPGRSPDITVTLGQQIISTEVRQSRRLPFGDTLEVIEERWIGNTGTIGVADHRRALRPECGYGEGHGDAMIPVRLDFRAAQFACLAAFDAQAVGALFHGGAHAAQIFG